ncbi:MAG: hypothetical protein LC117_03480 [Bacteroidia bacterium]|nr:hypothetical protein [Bacteroidia bacterium]MCZ2276974.1 hypothetical protein [Bacteroidia bacterium]
MEATVKSDSSITYNHIQEDEVMNNRSNSRRKVILRFVAEELIIAALLALIFYMI